jgi:hypothetical protein
LLSSSRCNVVVAMGFVFNITKILHVTLLKVLAH